MSPLSNILVVEDDQNLCQTVADSLTAAGHEVVQAGTGDKALEILKECGFHLVLADLRLPGAGGLDILDYINDSLPGTQVIMMSGSGSVDEAVAAMRRGAFDFQVKPLNLDHLNLTVERALERGALDQARDYLRHEQPFIYRFQEITAQSRGMKNVLDLAAKVAETDVTVMITGETGTGKSLVAGAIHANSPRRAGTLVTVNCAALPETLLESELFGHEKGSFTGAHKTRIGRFQQAHGGAVFLDEIGDMSPGVQAKVLRAIEEKVINRVGGGRAIKVDVRIMAATNVDLARAVDEGKFRQDLYYRLNVAPIAIPPLRERRADIIPLAEMFVQRICGEANQPKMPLSPATKKALKNHDWPGNIRELRNVIERALLFAAQGEITFGDLGLNQNGPALAAGASPTTYNLEELERWAIESTLAQCDYVQSRAAEMLGISPRALNYKLDKLAINHPRLQARRRRRRKH